MYNQIKDSGKDTVHGTNIRKSKSMEERTQNKKYNKLRPGEFKATQWTNRKEEPSGALPKQPHFVTLLWNHGFVLHTTQPVHLRT